MAATRAELEAENARLWQRLEAIYDELHDLFEKDEREDNDEE